MLQPFEMVKSTDEAWQTDETESSAAEAKNLRVSTNAKIFVQHEVSDQTYASPKEQLLEQSLRPSTQSLQVHMVQPSKDMLQPFEMVKSTDEAWQTDETESSAAEAKNLRVSTNAKIFVKHEVSDQTYASLKEQLLEQSLRPSTQS